MQLKQRPSLEQLVAYNGGARQEGILLNANESPYDMPDIVKEKLFKALTQVQFNRYPQIDAATLRQTIAASFDLTLDNIQLGNGSSAIIAACCHAFGGYGRKIAYISPSFSMYETYAILADSTACPFMLNEDFSLDVDKMLEFLHEQKPDVLILCNPNNPTGTLYSKKDLLCIVKNAPCLVLLDEAYMEFSDQSLIENLKDYDNLAILRTFSKAYGLASARVGYILSCNTNIIKILTKVLLPFQINSLSLLAAKIVYENKTAYNEQILKVIAQKDVLTKRLQALECKVYRSSTNFILFSLAKGKQDNANLSAFLATNGVFVRDFSTSDVLANAIRLTIGTNEQNAKVVELIERFLQLGGLK